MNEVPSQSGSTPDTDSHVSDLPTDPSNTAPYVRSWYDYQDECAALLILGRLDADDLSGVYIERSTDLALIPQSGAPELISIKHREKAQVESSSWTMSTLKKDVLPHLFQSWSDINTSCRATFCTNGGVTGAAYKLMKSCNGDVKPPDDIVSQLSNLFKAEKEKVRQFVESLSFVVDMPSREYIGDVGAREVERLLRRHRPGVALYSQECYDALCKQIALMSKDRPSSNVTEGTSKVPTVSQAIRQVQQLRRQQQYIASVDLLNVILQTQDKLSTPEILVATQPVWQSDPHFVGREDHLNKLDELLKPGESTEVSPVVVRGPAGYGKTSLATHYAATHSKYFRPIFISGVTREAVIAGLSKIAGEGGKAGVEEISRTYGPVSLQLPTNSNTLIIVDGVTDPRTVLGLIPRRNVCRIIITSTAHHLDTGYEPIDLDTWDASESQRYLETVLPVASESQASTLAQVLHGHPLAIAQAVSYCYAAAVDVDQFLRIYTAQPMTVLQHENVAGHADSIVKTTCMLLDNVQQQNPLATELLKSLAFFSADRISVDLFASELAKTFVSSPVLQYEPRQDRRPKWRQWISRRKPQMKRKVVHKTSSSAIQTCRNLHDSGKREEAVKTLLAHSLISRRSNHLALHPLVSLIIREQIDEALPYLEVCFNVLLPELHKDTEARRTATWQHLNHMHALVSSALNEGHHGAAVLQTGITLVSYLPIAPRSKSSDNRFLNVSDIAATCLTELEKQVSQRVAPIKPLIDLRYAAAELKVVEGDPDAAVLLLQQIFELCKSAVNGADEAITAITKAAIIATDFGRMDMVDNLRDALPGEDDLAEWRPKQQLEILHGNCRILRQENRISEAKRLNRIAFSIIEEVGEDSIPEYVVQLIRYDAAVLARDTENGIAVMQTELAALESAQRRWGHSPNWVIVMRICAAADGAIEAFDQEKAKALVNQADEMVKEHFSDQVDLTAELLCVRGRFHLMIMNLEKARDDLRESARLMRTMPNGITKSKLSAVLVNLSQAEEGLGNHVEAIACAREAIAFDLQFYPPGHPEVIKDRDNLIWRKVRAVASNGKEAARKVCAQKALECDMLLAGVDQPGTDTWFIGGVIARQKGVDVISAAVEWAEEVLRQAGRTDIEWNQGPKHSTALVSNPDNLLILNHGTTWSIIEVWAAHLQPLDPEVLKQVHLSYQSRKNPDK